jgi:2-oxo-3-hexenedioate decarboxylase
VEQNNIEEFAKRLHDARLCAYAIEKLSADVEGFTLENAYKIQDIGIDYRITAGETIIGSKMGLTSEAKRLQMDLHSPIYGMLTDKMQLQNGQEHSLKGTIHSKIEPEIAFFIDKDLKGKVTEEDVWDACSGVCVAMEILDSRFKNFKYFSLEDVVADNSSSSYFVLGEKVQAPNKNVNNLKMSMTVNGEIVQEGNSAAISSNPVQSIIQQCELFAERGLYLKAGSVVLAGAATPAVALAPGMEVKLAVQSLGDVSLNITE